MESGQIGVLLSSCCRSLGVGGCTRGLVPPLIGAFSSSQRGVKPLVVWSTAFQVRLAVSMAIVWLGVGAGLRNSVIPGCRRDVGNRYGVTGQHHGPHEPPQWCGDLIGQFIQRVRGPPSVTAKDTALKANSVHGYS